MPVAVVAASPDSPVTASPPTSNGVLDALQESVRAHWTAIHQYSILAAHFLRWGYLKLYASASADVKEEQEHLHRLLLRLEFFDTAPKFYPSAVEELPRHDFSAILAANLALERTAAAIEQAGIKRARDGRDELTAEVFEENLKGSEDAIRDITAAQRIVSQIGLDNYLANQT